MRVIAADPTSEFQEHGCAVFVGGDGCAEGEEPEVLEAIVQRVKRGIAIEPCFVALREHVGSECAKAQQVIASIHNHVDGEVIACVHAEVRAHGIADGNPLPLEVASKGGVLGAGAVFNSQKSAKNVHRVDTAEGRKHGSKFESDELGGGGAETLVRSNNRVVGLSGESVALKDDGNTARGLDFVHSSGVGIEVERGTGLVSHEGAGEVASAVQCSVGEAERFLAGGIVNEVAVAGVHVDGWDEASARGALDVVRETFPVDVTVFMKGE